MVAFIEPSWHHVKSQRVIQNANAKITFVPRTLSKVHVKSSIKAFITYHAHGSQEFPRMSSLEMHARGSFIYLQT